MRIGNVIRQLSYTSSQSAARRPLRCRLCRRVGAYVILSIVVIEAAILVPSYWNYKGDLLSRLERVGWAEVSVIFGVVQSGRDRDLLDLGGALLRNPNSTLLGAYLYSADGAMIGGFGSAPELTLERARAERRRRECSADGRSCDLVWDAAETGLPLSVAARLDASWVAAELRDFVWRVSGLVLLISLFVSAITMAILGRSVLRPLLRLRASLTAAHDDPARADAYVLPEASPDELGEVTRAVNRLLERVARTHRQELAAMTAMADRAADAILACDGAGQILYANPACLKLCGFADAAEMQAAGLPRFRFARDSAELTLPESLAGGAYSREAWLVARAGDTVPVYVNAARPIGDPEVPVQFYASVTDISELRAAEERLKQQNLELETANRAKSEFLANMSHELRTPLNAIIGFSEVLRDGLFGPLGNARYADYAEDIHASGVHLLTIINDILDLSKIEAGRMELQEADLFVGDLIEAVVPIVRGRAEAGGLALSTAVPDDLPMLRADPRAVKQILINLLSNAIKFTGKGGTVTISAAVDMDQIALVVSDTGIGIAEADLPRVFEAFGQVDGSLDRKHEGTGLGLPLVASVAELHGGIFKLDSRPGAGTTAKVIFPSRRTLSQPSPGPKAEGRGAAPPARSMA